MKLPSEKIINQNINEKNTNELILYILDLIRTFYAVGYKEGMKDL